MYLFIFLEYFAPVFWEAFDKGGVNSKKGT